VLTRISPCIGAQRIDPTILDEWSATRKLARRRVRKRLWGAPHLDLTRQLVTDDAVLTD